MGRSEGEADHIELTVPARADLLHLVRFHVGAAAAEADMQLEAVEDLQLAVDELCLSLFSQVGEHPGNLRVKVSWTEASVEVVCTVDAAATSAPPATNGKVGSATRLRPALPAELSARVLDALVDEHGMFTEPGCVGAWLRKGQIMTGRPT